jgi:hypothetical protein
MVQALILSLIGNSVQIGDGPAAVTLPLSDGEGNPFSNVPYSLCHWNF